MERDGNQETMQTTTAEKKAIDATLDASSLLCWK